MQQYAKLHIMSLFLQMLGTFKRTNYINSNLNTLYFIQ